MPESDEKKQRPETTVAAVIAVASTEAAINALSAERERIDQQLAELRVQRDAAQANLAGGPVQPPVTEPATTESTPAPATAKRSRAHAASTPTGRMTREEMVARFGSPIYQIEGVHPVREKMLAHAFKLGEFDRAKFAKWLEGRGLNPKTAGSSSYMIARYLRERAGWTEQDDVLVPGKPGKITTAEKAFLATLR